MSDDQPQTTEATLAERQRCLAIIDHHRKAHLVSAEVASSPMDHARHEQAAAALETVAERIAEP